MVRFFSNQKITQKRVQLLDTDFEYFLIGLKSLCFYTIFESGENGGVQ
jgi:hypothetical protein